MCPNSLSDESLEHFRRILREAEEREERERKLKEAEISHKNEQRGR